MEGGWKGGRKGEREEGRERGREGGRGIVRTGARWEKGEWGILIQVDLASELSIHSMCVCVWGGGGGLVIAAHMHGKAKEQVLHSWECRNMLVYPVGNAKQAIAHY